MVLVIQKKHFLQFFIILLVFMIVGIHTGFAQTVPIVDTYDTRINDQDFLIQVTPENPGPLTDITLRVSSDLVDVNRYPITWTVDGSVVAQGIGARSITTRTKNYGQTTTVRMSIRLLDSTVTKTFIVTPQDITLLWEAPFSYVPPFYQGKALPVFESYIQITAIPNFLDGTLTRGSKTAIYQWKRENRALPEAGGYGRDTILIQHNRIRPSEKIDVTASTVNRTSEGTASVRVPITEPFILFQEQNSFTGFRGKTMMDTFQLQSESVNIIAHPYFFSVINQNSARGLSLGWTMNNNPLPTPKTSSVIQLTKPQSRGATVINLEITTVFSMFQRAQRSISLFFNS